jgi:hypothetical protein
VLVAIRIRIRRRRTVVVVVVGKRNVFLFFRLLCL